MSHDLSAGHVPADAGNPDAIAPVEWHRRQIDIEEEIAFLAASELYERELRWKGAPCETFDARLEICEVLGESCPICKGIGCR